jgi:hypothetical protein
VDKAQFKVGSLDQLMELMDIFAKTDSQLDASCKRNEKMYFELCKEQKVEPKLVIEISTGRRGGQKQIQIQDYISTFKWDSVKF